MRQQPSDASGLSGSILRELLCIHNSFNLDGFDAMRAAAIDAMLIHQPEHCVPILSWALGGDGLSLGIRVEVVAALVRAAYVLSNTPTSSQPEHQAKDDSLLPRIGSDYMVPNQDRSEKTVVRRPRRLAMLQKEVRFYTNRFVSVATAFYEATAAPVRSFIRSSPSPHLKAGTPDDIEEMLPSQALMALAAFIRCTANHYSVHAIMIKETLLLADALKIYSGIGIRRAALSALHACVEALVEGSRRGSSPSTNLDRARPASGALDALTHLALRDTESASLDSNTLQRTDAIIGIVNWCIDFFQTEADGDCRVLMAAIIRLMPSFSAGSKLVK